MILKLAITLATFYHLLATVAALAGVLHMLRSLLGADAYQPFARRLFGWGEVHLWLSGLLIVGLGLAVSGLDYLDNPKLWTKVSVVGLWGANSLLIKRYLIGAKAVPRSLMMGISLASLIYGTFLGVAKPLAHGVASYPELMGGFALVLTACVGWLALQLSRHQVPVSRKKTNLGADEVLRTAG